jgi:hypothetical protein
MAVRSTSLPEFPAMVQPRRARGVDSLPLDADSPGLVVAAALVPSLPTPMHYPYHSLG